MGTGRLNITNRDTFKAFIPTAKPPYYTKRIIKSVHLDMISHDEVFAKLKEEGKEILIDNPDYLVGNRKTLGGIYSPLFGADVGSDVPIYSCECRKLTGASKAGQICPDCGTEVRSIEADLRLVGHIDIAPYHIMTFHGLTAMEKIIKNLDELLHTAKGIDLLGKIVPDDNYTIMDLYDRYDEDFFPLTGIPKKYAWTSKIPVYSARLRPLIKHGVQVTILEVNKHYQSIVNLSNSLPTTNKLHAQVQIQKVLNQIQLDFREVITHVLGQLGGKSGVIRRLGASGRFDYSSRMVISLGQDLRAHEIDIPYSTAMILFEEELVNRLRHHNDLSTADALAYFRQAQYYMDSNMVNIIKLFLAEGNGQWVLINRNPTINEQGIRYVRIRKIHDDFKDMTMSVGVDIISGMGADFDGDQLTCAGVKGLDIDALLQVFNPANAYIDRSSGRLQPNMMISRDYAAIHSYTWDCCKKLQEFLNNLDGDSASGLEAYGISFLEDDGEDAVMSSLNERIKTYGTKWQESFYDPDKYPVSSKKKKKKDKKK